MKSTPFIALRFTGSRFEDHTLPVSLVPDFKALEELLIVMVKDLYLNDHPGRSRVPKGFAKNVELRMTHIGNGSLSLSFGLNYHSTPDATSLFPDKEVNDHYFGKLKDKLTALLISLHQEKDILMSPQYFPYLNRLGRNLREDEVVDFGYDPIHKTGSDALLTHEVREKIEAYISSAKSTEKSLYARIPAIDQKKKEFKIELETKTIVCPLNSQILTEVLNAVNGYEDGRKVKLKVKAIVGSKSMIKKIEEVESIDILDPMDVSHRLYELAQLEDNWYEGYGKALPKKGLFAFEDLFHKYFDQALPLPAIFPTVEGNIQLEWQNRNHNVILETDLRSLETEYFYFDSQDDAKEEEMTISLRKKEGWEQLCLNLKKYFNG